MIKLYREDLDGMRRGLNIVVIQMLEENSPFFSNTSFIPYTMKYSWNLHEQNRWNDECILN